MTDEKETSDTNNKAETVTDGKAQPEQAEAATESTEKTDAESAAVSALPDLQEVGRMAKAIVCGVSSGIKQAVGIYRDKRSATKPESTASKTSETDSTTPDSEKQG